MAFLNNEFMLCISVRERIEIERSKWTMISLEASSPLSMTLHYGTYDSHDTHCSMIFPHRNRCVCIWRSHSFITYAKFSGKPTFLTLLTRTYAYQGLRNISFSKYFVYVLNEWSLRAFPKLDTWSHNKNVEIVTS